MVFNVNKTNHKIKNHNYLCFKCVIQSIQRIDHCTQPYCAVANSKLVVAATQQQQFTQKETQIERRRLNHHHPRAHTSQQKHKHSHPHPPLTATLTHTTTPVCALDRRWHTVANSFRGRTRREYANTSAYGAFVLCIVVVFFVVKRSLNSSAGQIVCVVYGPAEYPECPSRWAVWRVRRIRGTSRRPCVDAQTYSGCAYSSFSGCLW